MTVISRDPFARQDTVRRTVYGDACKWCGGKRWRRGRTLATLFQYGTDPDRIQPLTSWHTGLFCSKSCHDSYHG